MGCEDFAWTRFNVVGVGWQVYQAVESRTLWEDLLRCVKINNVDLHRLIWTPYANCLQIKCIHIPMKCKGKCQRKTRFTAAITALHVTQVYEQPKSMMSQANHHESEKGHTMVDWYRSLLHGPFFRDLHRWPITNVITHISIAFYANKPIKRETEFTKKTFSHKEKSVNEIILYL